MKTHETGSKYENAELRTGAEQELTEATENFPSGGPQEPSRLTPLPPVEERNRLLFSRERTEREQSV